MVLAKLKGFLSEIVYEKTLKTLYREFSKEDQTGKFSSLLSSDLEFIDNLILLPYIVRTPLFLIGTAIFLWFTLGVAGIAGLGVIILHNPFVLILGKLSGKYRIASATLGDTRIKMITNLIEGIRIIKLYGWEHPYLESVFATRKLEIAEIKRKGLTLCMIRRLNYGSTAMSLLVTFLYIYISRQ